MGVLEIGPVIYHQRATRSKTSYTNRDLRDEGPSAIAEARDHIVVRFCYRYKVGCVRGVRFESHGFGE